MYFGSGLLITLALFLGLGTSFLASPALARLPDILAPKKVDREPAPPKFPSPATSAGHRLTKRPLPQSAPVLRPTLRKSLATKRPAARSARAHPVPRRVVVKRRPPPPVHRVVRSKNTYPAHESVAARPPMPSVPQIRSPAQNPALASQPQAGKPAAPAGPPPAYSASPASGKTAPTRVIQIAAPPKGGRSIKLDMTRREFH